MENLLELENISKSFPGVKALNNVNLSLKKGEIHALMGENGAGKSTLMKIICGIYQSDHGKILVEGVEKNFASYRDAIDCGIGIIFQELSLIPHLNAVENIFLNREMKNSFGLLNRKAMRSRAQLIFKSLEVKINLNKPVEQLSIADQQFVEIAKALSLDAKILVLDEPTATLTPKEAEHLFGVMRDLRSLGVGMFFISHHLEEIYEICDRISVLRDGSYIGSLSVRQSTPDALVEMMVGRKLENTFPDKNSTVVRQQPVLQVDNLKLNRRSQPTSFRLYPGEILGFAGLVGSGRTEAVRALIGADKPESIEITYQNKKVRIASPATALQLGIGIVPEDRKSQGLLLDFSVKHNIVLNNHADEKQWRFFINRRKESGKARDLVEKVRVKTPDVNTRVGDLSGGNQQKVVIARWLNNDCRVLIFDEPTRGIDVGAKAEIYNLMRALTAKGVAIIMISSELPEIIGICDRVNVFRENRIVAELSESQIDSNLIMLHATGNAK
ncbi:ribonucleotide-diphosphate reductase subunit alpha [Izhakiella australiensis]|uniref:Ribonucleotide-diphosphate reductase subunit alpha n=1 Tax=Izhakiella australiensis TaxID=1926881 RepID=A0A1S8YTD6_9GAMM|nr:sugar ABC transporter ATP-binding protein [Izhakiella australiensis]OON42096.1 ribonucleotide-diphosphate reductase subunit alpha [Izhakiella australiensis]